MNVVLFVQRKVMKPAGTVDHKVYRDHQDYQADKERGEIQVLTDATVYLDHLDHLDHLENRHLIFSLTGPHRTLRRLAAVQPGQDHRASTRHNRDQWGLEDHQDHLAHRDHRASRVVLENQAIQGQWAL